MVQPISLSSGQRAMESMAAVATSAALPWMGVLIAARNACPWRPTNHTFCQLLLTNEQLAQPVSNLVLHSIDIDRTMDRFGATEQAGDAMSFWRHLACGRSLKFAT